MCAWFVLGIDGLCGLMSRELGDFVNCGIAFSTVNLNFPAQNEFFLDRKKNKRKRRNLLVLQVFHLSYDVFSGQN